MIDPFSPTRFDRSPAELEEFLLFAIAVAGKPAQRTAYYLDRFLGFHPGATPFAKVAHLHERGILTEALMVSSLGQHTRLSRAFSEVMVLNPATCSLGNLEAIHGIGPKTARFFLLHSRPGQHYAALDTHILKYLAEKGHEVPRQTPTSHKQYQYWEKVFLGYAERLRMTPVELDFLVWAKYARKEVRDAA